MSTKSGVSASGSYLDLSKSGQSRSQMKSRTGRSASGMKSRTGRSASGMKSRTGATKSGYKSSTGAPTKSGTVDYTDRGYTKSATGRSGYTKSKSGYTKTGKTGGATTMGVSTRLPTGIFDTRKPSSSGYTKSGDSVEPMTSRYSKSGRSGRSKSGRSQFSLGKSSRRASSKLELPGKSGRGSSRSGRSKSGRSGYSKSGRSGFKSQTGMSALQSVRSASGWVPTGNMVELDQGELAELERMIMALTERAEESEARAAQLHQVPIKDVLTFIIKNSNTANVTIGDEVCPPGYDMDHGYGATQGQTQGQTMGQSMGQTYQGASQQYPQSTRYSQGY